MVEGRVRCSESIHRDELLLRRGAFAIRTAVLSDRAVSVGAGVRPEAAYLLRSESAGIPVVRRTTGGTGVLHAPGDLVWSVVLRRADPRVGNDYVHAYPRLGEGVVRFLSEEGVAVAWQDPLGVDPDYCFLSARGSVLGVGGRVLGGAAQHLSGGALLHSGVLPLELDRNLLAELFGLSERFLGRLTSLRELGIEGAPEALAQKLAKGLDGSLSRPSSRSLARA